MKSKGPKAKYLPKIKFGLRYKIALGVLAVYLIVFIIGGMAAYYKVNGLALDSFRDKAQTIASTAAAVIDAEKHAQLKHPSDEYSKTYREIQTQLQKIVAANPDVDSIYTLVESGKKNIWLFVVDSYETQDLNKDGRIEPDEEKAHLGEEYDISPYPEMQKAFDNKQPGADTELTTDKWGTWLSGYAPLKDKNGRVVAMVGADIRASDVLLVRHRIKQQIILIISILTIILFIFVFLLTYFILKPFGKFYAALEAFGQGNLASRVKGIKSHDEFNRLAFIFNQMADKIEQVHHELRQEVLKRTKNLRSKTQALEKINRKLKRTQLALLNILEDLKKAKEETEEAKNKYEAILKNVGDGIYALDISGRALSINKAAEEISGWSAKNLLGRKIKNYIKIVDENNKQLFPAIKSMEEDRIIKLRNVYLKGKGGKKVPVSLTASPLKDRTGRTIGGIVVFRDISHERELDRMKDEFVSTTSHELRTPMTAIKGYLSMILEGDFGPVSPRIKELLKEAYQSNERLIRLVEDVLDVSRIEQGRIEINLQSIHLSELISTVIDSLKLQAKHKNLYLLLEKCDPKIHVLADPDKLKQVLINLVGNALKFTHKGGVKIRVELKKDKSQAIVYVADTGIGINKKEQNLLFRKFQQLGKTLTRHPGGTGLGLYISKKLVELMGGEIWLVKSIPGKGSTFAFSLPVIGGSFKSK